MKNLTKIFILGFSLFFIFSGIALAQEVIDTTEQAIELDQDVEPEDLEIEEPRILPDSPFYFLKNWGRGIQEFFAFNPVTKIKLKERFANERLIELKRIIEKEKSPEIVQSAAEQYQEEVDKIREISDKIQEKAQENPELEKFLDKFVKNQILHQRLLEKLENQVPPEAFEKIKTVRERHLERFAEVMTKLEDRTEKIRERLEEKMEEIEGSKYKQFKNLEILLELGDKVPEQAKEAILRAQENTLKRLKGDLEKMSPEDQEKFEEYLEKIGGIKERQLEILENLRLELEEMPEIQEKIMEIRETVVDSIKERIRRINCPEFEKPTPDFCEEGRIVVKQDERGCIISFECIIPGEVEIPSQPEKPLACITLWDPVCGKNGKTYSNSCFARLAEIEVDYKGQCQTRECLTDTDCPQPRCAPTTTLSTRCIGVKAKCVEGKCQILSISTELAP